VPKLLGRMIIKIETLNKYFLWLCLFWTVLFW